MCVWGGSGVPGSSPEFGGIIASQGTSGNVLRRGGPELEESKRASVVAVDLQAGKGQKVKLTGLPEGSRLPPLSPQEPPLFVRRVLNSPQSIDSLPSTVALMRMACRRILYAFIAAGFMVVAGCALFQQGAAVLYHTTAKARSNENPLPPIQAHRDAMEVVIVFAERPVGDRLLGPALWKEIAQVGSISAEDRLTLEKCGLRAGNAGNSMSPELERLLGINTKPFDVLNAGDSQIMQGRKSFLLSGSEELISINRIKSCTMKVPASDETREYQDAAGALRMWVHKVQDGWARIEFQPEIHHGAAKMRPVAANGAWGTSFSPEIDPFASCRFSVNLHEGEMAIVTADGSDPQSLGSCCFVSGDEKAKVQRVLVVRLSKMTRTEAVYAERSAQ